MHRSTLMNHVLRLHLESAFVVTQLKIHFSKPICVKENDRHGTINAFYQIETNGQPFLLVAVQIQGQLKKMTGQPHFIKSFYGVSKVPSDCAEEGKLP